MYNLNGMNIKNPKIGMYCDSGITFMNLEFQTEINDGNGENHLATISIPKIGFQNLNIEMKSETESNQWGLYNKKSAELKLMLLPFKENGDLFTITLVDPVKIMTKAEIEKALGYKIKIKDDDNDETECEWD